MLILQFKFLPVCLLFLFLSLSLISLSLCSSILPPFILLVFLPKYLPNHTLYCMIQKFPTPDPANPSNDLTTSKASPIITLIHKKTSNPPELKGQTGNPVALPISSSLIPVLAIGRSPVRPPSPGNTEPRSSRHLL